MDDWRTAVFFAWGWRLAVVGFLLAAAALLLWLGERSERRYAERERDRYRGLFDRAADRLSRCTCERGGECEAC